MVKVYVLNKHGEPLMPCKASKARRLLKDNKAKVVKRTPFTIQLLYGSSGYKQPITLGVDAGSKQIGLSATTEVEELYASEVELRNDIVELISIKKEYRHTRRGRKTRHRKERFLNRRREKGWLTPSVNQKIECHLNVVDRAYKLLPITKIIVETASFDIQKIQNPDIESIEYQRGPQFNFWNVREYVLFRDNHTCQCCKGKSKDKRLNVHHIETRLIGGDAPNNLITLCETCHRKYHDGLIKLPANIRRGMSFRDAAFMGIMRWAFYNRLKALYPDVSMTYGYITKNTRIMHKLPKTHCVDARCISGHPTAKPLGYYFYQKKVRCHNRQIHKMTIQKGGKRKNNQVPYEIFGFRLFDKVKCDGDVYFVFGRRARGCFDIRSLHDKQKRKEVSYKRLQLLEPRNAFLIEKVTRNDI